MGRKYTIAELKEQDPDKWTDEKIQEWGSESGKVEGIGRGSSGVATVGELRRDTDKDTGGLRVSDTMELLGNAGAGKDRIDSGAFDAGSGRTLLYDDATGNVYGTSEWKDVSRNEQAWVDNRGLRFKGWAVAYGEEGTGDSAEALYGLRSVGQIDYTARKKGGQNMLAAFGDSSVPQAGTAEFQDWVRKEVSISGMAQALGNTYDSETGKFGEKGTDMGQFGFISAADWLASGRKSSGIAGAHSLALGEDELASLESMSDEDVLAKYGGGFFTRDTKKRKSGIEKSLGSSGARIANIVVPIAAGLGGVAANSFAQAAMAGASGYSASGGDWDAVAKEVSINVGTQAATAALAAATAGIGSGVSAAASASAAASSGGMALAGSYASTAVAAATRGAIASGGASLADSALRRVIYGSDFNGRLSTGKIFENAGRSAAIGGVTAAIASSAGRFFQTSPEAIGQNRWSVGANNAAFYANQPSLPASATPALSPDAWQTGVSGALFDAGLRGGTAYGVQRLFGSSPEDSGLSAASDALSSLADSSNDAMANNGARGDPAPGSPGSFWSRFTDQFGPAYALRPGVGRLKTHNARRRASLAAATGKAYAEKWY